MKINKSEKPILFSTPMIHGIQNDRKSQTRRVVRIPSWTWDKHTDLIIDENGNLLAMSKKTGKHEIIKPPYEAGMRLWVRETWQKKDCNECPAANYPCALPSAPCIFGDRNYLYKADPYSKQPLNPLKGECSCELYEDMRWRPSIHMPRVAARLFLTVKAIKPERLQDISEENCYAEGITWFSKDKQLIKYAPADFEGDGPIWPWSDCPKTPAEAYHKYWDELNAERGYIWSENPVVWVISFEREKQTLKEVAQYADQSAMQHATP